MITAETFGLDPRNYSLADLVVAIEEKGLFEEKTKEETVVSHNDKWYVIPNFCLSDLLWGQPDSFYPCNKYEWADHPIYLTTLEMVKSVIVQSPEKFVSFILPDNYKTKPLYGRAAWC